MKKTISQIIKNARQKQQLTQHELASKAKLSIATVRNIEQGSKTIDKKKTRSESLIFETLKIQ